ncbi:MAG TPA: sulfite exporter TauE/SafE family protein [Desulfobacterales bacterium]
MPGFESLDPLNLALLLAVLAFAGAVHGALGLGFPMIATPLLALRTDVLSAMLIVLVPTLAVNILSILKGGRWGRSIERFWPLAAFGALGSIAGTRLLVATDPEPYRLVLAAVILLYLNVRRFGVRMQWVNRRRWLAFGVFGISGGLLAGTVNVMVPALIVFALEAGLAATVTVQVFNFCFLAGKLSQAAVFTAAGLLTPNVLLNTAPLAAVTLLALALGMAVRDRIDAETYRRWLRKVLYLIAVLLVVQFFVD